ncbi:hypothetical protein [Roseobacter sp. S98]|uniref:hypothetical protein n=1 Tax=Roseobacter algicola (ex Choi et al. 2025) (nom. illeg.) TaxID=3092138 RepID=UPI0035C6D020
MLRAKLMYDPVEGLTATGENLICKVGNSHVVGMNQIIRDMSADIEIPDRTAYEADLHDVLNPAVKDN